MPSYRTNNIWHKRLLAADVQRLHGKTAAPKKATKVKRAKKKQAGYFDISTLDVVFFFLIVALLGGFFFYKVLPWLWRLVKPFIHAVTG